MRSFHLTAALATAVVAPFALHGVVRLTAPDLTVGRSLQISANIVLPQPAPPAGSELTLTSEDPSRMLLALMPDKAGAPSIKLNVIPGAAVSPDFWVQGLSDRGVVRYTISAPSLGGATGTVTLKPSAIAIFGPFHTPSFPTTPRAAPAELTVLSGILDDSQKLVQEQPIAGGSQIEVALTNSNPLAGALPVPKLTLAGGSSRAVTYFKPAAEGVATITPNQPPGFTSPAVFGSVIASVERPGVAITSELTIGKDLQMLGVLCLGEPPPQEGLQVTLTSSDPRKLLLSAREDEPGSASLTITVPLGELTAKYFLQSLGETGSVTYWASAPGFRHRIGKIDLAPSGMILSYRPEDQSHVLEQVENGVRRIKASLAEARQNPIRLRVYTAYLDPASGIPADIQPLRPGVSVAVSLKSSNPAVGSVESPLTISSAATSALTRFKAASIGETLISIQTPAGFSTPKNAGSALATIVP